MKRSIFDPMAKQEIVGRIETLTSSSKGKWGKLSVAQMVRHLTEANRLAFGEIPMPDRSNLLTRTLIKWMFLSNIKPPGREKGKIQTLPEVDIVNLAMTLEGLETEKDHYKQILDRLTSTSQLHHQHALFGKMSRKDWGNLVYAHADYHLTQFGV